MVEQMRQSLLEHEEETSQASGAGTATPNECYELLKAQGFKCALSGQRLTPDSMALDHIVAVKDGGSDCISNLQWVDARVNRMKGSMSDDELIQICVRVTAHRFNGSLPGI